MCVTVTLCVCVCMYICMCVSASPLGKEEQREMDRLRQEATSAQPAERGAYVKRGERH